MRNTCTLSITLLVVGAHAISQPLQNLRPVFEVVGPEFYVPPAILKGIAFVESRWAQLRPEDGVTDNRHMPPAYGVMGLRDDDWFGHSLTRAAALLGVEPSLLKESATENIRGAAALLRELALDQAEMPGERLETWFDVVARYSGIPQNDIRGTYTQEVFRVLHDGYNEFGIEIEQYPVNMFEIDARMARDYPREQGFSPSSDDYAPAVWYASPNFNSRGGSPITHVIIHDTEGNFAGSLSWLTNPASQVSAHYLFRSVDGYLAQMVREADRAWHVGCWNSWTIGIEHEGYVNQPQYFTQIMYQNSALLVRHLCDRYNIAKDRLRIVGHFVWQDPVIFPQLGWDPCNTHTDPGPFWNWNYFLSLIVADSTPPAIVSHYPRVNQQGVPIYKDITITFDRTMELFSTQGAFSISPTVAGSLRWSTDGKTLRFDPTNNLPPSESYQVNLMSTARGAGGGALSQALQFSFTTALLDTVGPRIVRSFPEGGATSVSQWMGFQIWFDEPVVFSSFAGRVRLVDLADTLTALGVGSVVYQDIEDRGLLTFFPSAPLQLGHSYRVMFLPGVRDVLGNQTTSESRIEFTVQTTPFVQGSVIDPFEDNSAQWQQPWTSPTTTGVDTALTKFSISSTYKKSGGYSGKLTYAFTDSINGVCRLANGSAPPVTTGNGWLGFWVLGDNSGNHLEYWFSTVWGETPIVNVGPIDWFGWRLVSVPLSSVPGDVAAFNSIVIRQGSGTDRSGTLYLDDMQLETVTAVNPGGGVAYRTFKLFQNYPNPFNPSTTIHFELERPEHTTLAVYNTLGQQVAMLLDKPLEAGLHSIQFSGTTGEKKNLPSGLYIYRLQTSAGSEMKKMILLK